MAFLQSADTPRPGFRSILMRLAVRLRQLSVPRSDDGSGKGLRPALRFGTSPSTDAATALLLRDLGHR